MTKEKFYEYLKKENSFNKEETDELFNAYLEDDVMYYMLSENNEDDNSCDCSACKFYRSDKRIIAAYPKVLFEDDNTVKKIDKQGNVEMFSIGVYQPTLEQFKQLTDMLKDMFSLTSFWFLESVYNAYEEKNSVEKFKKHLFDYKMNSDKINDLKEVTINDKYIYYLDGDAHHEIKLEENMISWTWKTTSDHYLRMEFKDNTIKVLTNKGRFGYFKFNVYGLLQEILI